MNGAILFFILAILLSFSGLTLIATASLVVATHDAMLDDVANPAFIAECLALRFGSFTPAHTSAAHAACESECASVTAILLDQISSLERFATPSAASFMRRKWRAIHLHSFVMLRAHPRIESPRRVGYIIHRTCRIRHIELLYSSVKTSESCSSRGVNFHLWKNSSAGFAGNSGE